MTKRYSKKIVRETIKKKKEKPYEYYLTHLRIQPFNSFYFLNKTNSKNNTSKEQSKTNIKMPQMT